MAEPLDDVIGRLVDGDPVDWPAEEDVSDPALRALLAQLRVIDRVHESHRTLPDVDAIEPPPPPDRPRTDGETATASGPRWGKYRLLASIGEGSFGNVYRALDELLHRELAIKLLKPGITARDGFGPRLLREAKDLAKVRHPNVVTIYGVEEHAGQVGLCMEIIEGRTLEAAVRLDGPLNADEAVVVGQAVGRGLAALHHAGLLHRDVKAKNVMRERAGRFVLMDLGASLDTTDPSRMAHARATGTPLYMAPELFEGGASTVQSDVYSLGVLLYFLVTGRYPVEADSYDGLRQAHATGATVALAERRLDLPAAFVRTVERALSVDPARRFATANDLMAALGGSSTSLPLVAGQRRVDGTRTVLIISAAVVVLGLISERYFNLSMGLGEFATDGISDWFRLGVQSLTAPLVIFALGTAMVAVASAAWRLAVSFLPPAGRAERRVREIASALRLDTLPVASGIALVVASLALLSTWWLSLPVLELLLGIFPDDISTAPSDRLAILGPAYQAAREQYREGFAWCVFASVAVWYPVWKMARGDTRNLNRVVVYGGVAVFVLAVALMTFPYRLIVQGDAETATWKDQACYVIGERGGAVMLFCPEIPPPRNVTVDVRSPDLVRLGASRPLFERITRAK
jgi:eukaryotic-like serine/threonine-protein kinase